MIRRSYIWILLVALLMGYLATASLLRSDRQDFINEKFVEYTIPSEFLKPLSLEFKGLSSDLLLVKFMTFIGARTGQLNDFTKEDWAAVKSTLETITDLDPYYWDAYLYAQVFLTWDETHFESANSILKKALRYIPDNYRIPYYIGLNYYNFGNDSEKGAQYLMAASKIEGCPQYIAQLATRLSAYASDYERAIIFLNEMIKQTRSPEMSEQYKLRLTLMESMHYIDQGIETYKAKYGRLPSGLHELVTSGSVQSIPIDPYGGEFYLTNDGRIDTTSKMLKN